MENRGVRRALVALTLAAVAWTGVAAAEPIAAKATKTSDHRLRLVKSWPEDVSVEGRSVPGRVEIWFDYTAGVAIHRIVLKGQGPAGADRVLTSKTFAPGMGAPRPSPEEIAEAMDIVRGDKEIARVIEVTHAVLDGGFQIFEGADKPCGPGSRCLEVQLMTQDRLGFIRNVIVDLTKQAIVYRTYMPAEEGKGK